jgi:proteasome accessory factor C
MSGATRGPDPVHVRLHLLLVILPWLAEHGETTVAEVAARFGVSEARVTRVLETAMLCGRPPFGGGDNLDLVLYDDGTIQVGPRLASEVRPPRLTSREAVQVLAALRAALALPGADPEGPLARVTVKLEAVLGSGIDVTLHEPPYLGAVRDATAGGERLRITYFSASRGELSERTIDPHVVFSRDGEWYVWADDSRSGKRRSFRVDRIEAAEPTGERFEPDQTEPPGGWFEEGGAVDVTVVLPAAAAWLAEQYPVHAVRDAGEGMVEVRLPVATERFLERLLVRAGPEARVLDPPEYVDLGRRAAARLLSRYES